MRRRVFSVLVLDYGHWLAIETTLAIVNIRNLSNFLQRSRSVAISARTFRIWPKTMYHLGAIRIQPNSYMRSQSGTSANTYHLLPTEYQPYEAEVDRVCAAMLHSSNSNGIRCSEISMLKSNGVKTRTTKRLISLAISVLPIFEILVCASSVRWAQSLQWT